MGDKFAIKVDTSGLIELRDSLRHVSRQASDFRPVWRSVVPAWTRSNRRMFQTSGASKGRPWVEYRGEELRRYVPYKLGKRAGRQILVFDAGTNARKLMKSLTEESHALFVGHPEISPVKLTLGTLVDYSKSHDGSTRAPDWLGGYIIPRREHVLLGDDLERQIDEFMDVFAVQLGQMLGDRITTQDLIGLPVAAGGFL